MKDVETLAESQRWFTGTWSRISVFWRFQLGGWFAYLIFSLPIKWAVVENFDGSLLVSLYRDFLGFMLTLGMRVVYRQIDHGEFRVGRMGLIIFAVSLSAGTVLTCLSLLLDSPFDFREDTLFETSAIFGVFYFRSTLCLGWSLLYFGIKLALENGERQVRLAQTLTERRETELLMLRALINSHFLFNALNTILAAIEQQRKGVAEMVQALADYLNYSLRHKDDDLVFLGEEVDALMDYLVLEQARFGHNLDVACQIDPTLRSRRVPGIILQPVVENAIKYGRETWTPPVLLRLVLTQKDSDLVIEVANTGQWVKPDPNRQTGGVGLENIRKRLNLLYPSRHKVEVVAEEGWVSVRLCIPAKP